MLLEVLLSMEMGLCTFYYSIIPATREASSSGPVVTVINTKGQAGCNMPCDSYMEHSNRRIKTRMGSNINPNSVIRAGQNLSNRFV